MAELVGKNNEEKIWNYLISEGYTEAGAAGIMGNLYAESALSTNNIEGKYEGKYGNDIQYTAAINNKTYTKDQFVNDKAGYGLAQWTYYTRKRGLYEATVEKGLSVADLEGQLSYLVKELKTYKALNNLLRSTNSLYDASDAVLKDFERPAILAYDKRRGFSKKYYDKYAKRLTSDEDTTPTTTTSVDYSKYKTYTVKQGESWWSIAAKFLESGTKMNELAKFNNKTTNTMLHTDDVIFLPILKDESDTEETTTDSKYYTIHIVKPGESWYKIAEIEMGDGNKMVELAKFNGKTTKDIIHPNDELKIPSKSSTVTPAPNYNEYEVKPGDSWWKIAKTQMGSWTKMHQLAKFNGRTIKDIVRSGEILKIPK